MAHTSVASKQCKANVNLQFENGSSKMHFKHTESSLLAAYTKSLHRNRGERMYPSRNHSIWSKAGLNPPKAYGCIGLSFPITKSSTKSTPTTQSGQQSKDVRKQAKQCTQDNQIVDQLLPLNISLNARLQFFFLQLQALCSAELKTDSLILFLPLSGT